MAAAVPLSDRAASAVDGSFSDVADREAAEHSSLQEADDDPDGNREAGGDRDHRPRARLEQMDGLVDEPGRGHRLEAGHTPS